MKVTTMSLDEQPTAKVVKDEQIDLAAKNLMSVILALRAEISCSPIQVEPLYLTEAAEKCTIGTVGNTVGELLMLQEQGDSKDLIDWMDKHFTKVIVCVVILIIPLLYYMIINR
jgi:hypothetical protein